jgi:hypothetical protein
MGKRLLYKPIAHTTAEGRVAVYVGGSYAQLDRDEATVMRDQLAAAIDELDKRQAVRTVTPAGAPTPAPFGEQLARFQRNGLAAQSAVDRQLTEARAMADLDKEAQS